MELKVKTYCYAIHEQAIDYVEIVRIDDYPTIRVRSPFRKFYYIHADNLYQTEELAEKAFRPYLENEINQTVETLTDIKALIKYAQHSDPDSYVAQEVIKRATVKLV